MPEYEIGWIAAIVIGGLAGWFAEMFMKSGTGKRMSFWGLSEPRWRTDYLGYSASRLVAGLAI
jgi:hypothetical protein